MSAIGWHFVTLPDTDAATPLVHRVGAGHTVLRHPSGRPWLLHTYPRDQVVACTPGTDSMVALVGFASASPDNLAGAARHADGPQRLARELAGSFWVLASFGGATQAYGSASGVRRIHHARIDGVWVASDRADVLADLGSFGFDEVTLALRTMTPLAHPLPDQPLFAGVEPVAPGDALFIDADGERCRQQHWWQPPPATLNRSQGAERLRDGLAAAVATRTAAGGVVHSDLSGGFDSTPITYFAAQGPATIHAATAFNTDPGGGDDLIWANRALQVMPWVVHRSYSLDGLPGFYTGLSEVATRFDEPSDTVRAAPRMTAMMRDAAERGARVYLNGIGGDHLLTALPAWDHTILRRRPLTALRRARTWQLLEGQSAGEAFGPLFHREAYRGWFGRMVRDMSLRDPYATPKLRLGWDDRMFWPRWLTADHRSAVHQRLREVARTVDGLAPQLGDHYYLASVRKATRTARAGAHIGATMGIAFESPLFDDRVVEACLATRLSERGEPRRYKPLMREAMRGLLPDDFLRRTTKTNGGAQTSRGIRASEPELFGICRDSTLAQLGIVDLEQIRQHAFPRERWMPVRDIDATLTCALFTRNHTGGRRLTSIS